MEETGSIRISANGPRVSVEIYQKPTLSQLKTLVKKYNDDINLHILGYGPREDSIKDLTKKQKKFYQ